MYSYFPFHFIYKYVVSLFILKSYVTSVIKASEENML